MLSFSDQWSVFPHPHCNRRFELELVCSAFSESIPRLTDEMGLFGCNVQTAQTHITIYILSQMFILFFYPKISVILMCYIIGRLW